MTGSMVIELGTRSLGLLACLDHSTVVRDSGNLAVQAARQLVHRFGAAPRCDSR